jgi:hypothetical protein
MPATLTTIAGPVTEDDQAERSEVALTKEPEHIRRPRPLWRGIKAALLAADVSGRRIADQRGLALISRRAARRVA